MDEPRADLADLAEEVRRLYWEERIIFEEATVGMSSQRGPRETAVYDGGDSHTGRRYKPVWPRLAEHFLQTGLSPREAIRSLFESARGTRAPHPQLLLSLRSAPKLSRMDRKTMIENDFEAEKNSARREFELQRNCCPNNHVVARLTITTPSRSLTPLFRVWLAVKLGQPDLVEMYNEPAFRQYCEYPLEYDKVMGQYLPEDFPRRYQAMKEVTSSPS